MGVGEGEGVWGRAGGLGWGGMHRLQSPSPSPRPRPWCSHARSPCSLSWRSCGEACFSGKDGYLSAFPFNDIASTSTARGGPRGGVL